MADGYTQPIVTHDKGNRREVVDGFHRNRVGKESQNVRKRVKGYLPVVTIRAERADEGNRMAATIRHNRARGKHQVDLMGEMVEKLLALGWKEIDIAKHLGMEAEEVLRLKRQQGIASQFANQPFGKAWVRDTSDALLQAGEGAT